MKTCLIGVIDMSEIIGGFTIDSLRTKEAVIPESFEVALREAAPLMLEALQNIQFRCEFFIDDGRSMKVPSVEAIKSICDEAITKALAQ